MYGWERRGGDLPNRHAESITRDDVLADLARTRDVLTGARARKDAGDRDGAVRADDTEATGALAAPELEETLDASAYSTWTDAKARAAESYARGDFVAAAGLFAVAAAMIEPSSGEDPGGVNSAGLQSNRSCALLAAGRPEDAFLAADACVATRPEWPKARYRRAEALFALRRFRECSEDVALATKLSGDSPDPVLAKRAADCDAALAELAVLDEMETEHVKEKEEEEAKARNAEQEERDRQLAELTAAAEERERDPAVRALFKRLEKTFEEAKAAGSETGPDPFECEDLLNKILTLEPDFTACSFQLALIQRRLGRHAAAIETMRSCLHTGAGFMTGYSQFGQMLEQVHGKECRGFQEAELLYANVAQRYFDHPDAWIGFSTLLMRHGRVNDAIAVLRAAMVGGPEGKFVKPRQDGVVLMTLSFAQHMRGHSAEPTSLYMLSVTAGGGSAAMFLLRRIFEDCGDDENADTYAEALTRMKRDSPQELWRAFEAINWMYAAPHWVTVLGKLGLAERMRASGLEGRIVARSYDVHERKESDPPIDFIPGNYIAKGKNRVYEGTHPDAPRVRRCERIEDVEAFLGDDAECLLAQRCVSDPATLDDGRKYSLHFYVVVFGVSSPEPENDGDETGTVDVRAKVTKGFRLCVAPGGYVEGGEDDDAHLTNRGVRGDSGAVDSAEIDDVAAFGARAGIDWEAQAWPAITNALRVTLIALCAGMVGDGDAVGDFSMAAHQSMRIPKIVEAAFVLDASGAPWLVDLCQPECSNPRAKTLHAAVEEAMGCAGDGESALESLF